MMYNLNIPKDFELPSTRQLIKSTAIALITALILLVTVVFPAEYGVDPTGLGQILGLTKMGEIKQQLASEAEQNVQQLVPLKVAKANVDAETKAAEATPSETTFVQLQPGQAAEIKLVMKKGAIVTYKWSVDSGHVNYDTHGDGEDIMYFGYGKGKSTTEDQGKLQAAFDGNHGWYWVNRSNNTVTVTLNVSGDYSEIFRML